MPSCAIFSATFCIGYRSTTVQGRLYQPRSCHSFPVWSPAFPPWYFPRSSLPLFEI